MLRRILELLAADRPMRMDELSRALGAREAEVESQLEQLTRLGFVEDLASKAACGTESACAPESACARCGSRAGCAAASPSRIWALTEKGRRSALNGKPA
ncbi:MAG TPA: FeoC-like transcriptional regulator [Spirochaetia bacterium]|nr:FeoC-like transcriptional regulator [Spirochaetia bacterium]